jgi:hypothetical protein
VCGYVCVFKIHYSSREDSPISIPEEVDTKTIYLVDNERIKMCIVYCLQLGLLDAAYMIFKRILHIRTDKLLYTRITEIIITSALFSILKRNSPPPPKLGV